MVPAWPPVSPTPTLRPSVGLSGPDSERAHPVGPHLDQGTEHTTPALHFAATLSFLPRISPPLSVSAASPRSSRPAHARAQPTSSVGRRTIGPHGARLSGPASYTVVKSVVLCGTGECGTFYAYGSVRNLRSDLVLERQNK